MISGKEYARQRWERLKKSPYAWHLTAKKFDKVSERITRSTLKKLTADSEYIYSLIDASYKDDDMDGKAHFSSVLDALMISLREDVNIYTDGKYQNLFDKTGLAITALGRVHAITTNVDDFLNPLDGHAIFIEIGTYYSIQLLAKAIIVENFENEYASYKEDGTRIVGLATELYIHNNMEIIKEVYFHNLPEHVEVDASAAQSSVTIKVLQFIALHEFGHVVNGDRGVMSFNEKYIHGKKKSHNEFKSFEQEYSADLFAINALFSDQKTPSLNHWSGFYTIFFFLAWLHSVESKLSEPISGTHPPSLDRAWRLHERMLDITKNEDYGYTDLLLEVEKKFK